MAEHVQPTVEVHDDGEHHRFEAVVDGRHAGYAFYRDEPGQRVFTHTEVDDAFGGQGVGSQLARHALDATRAAGLQVVPHCSFIKGWIEHHPDYQDLVGG